jgi:SUKH superfamily protein
MRQLTILGEKNEMDLWVIEEFERQIGYCLPKSYKELMSKYNNLWIKRLRKLVLKNFHGMDKVVFKQDKFMYQIKIIMDYLD